MESYMPNNVEALMADIETEIGSSQVVNYQEFCGQLELEFRN
jgi:hypothetical protein